MNFLNFLLLKCTFGNYSLALASQRQTCGWICSPSKLGRFSVSQDAKEQVIAFKFHYAWNVNFQASLKHNVTLILLPFESSYSCLLVLGNGRTNTTSANTHLVTHLTDPVSCRPAGATRNHDKNLNIQKQKLSFSISHGFFYLILSQRLGLILKCK